MKIVTVIPLAKGVFREDLTYFTSKEIKEGDITSVTVRNRKILALVVSAEAASNTKTNIKDLNFSLKKILEVKESSMFLKEYLDSAIATGEYFIAKKNIAIASMIPAILLEDYDKISKFKIADALPVIKNSNLKTEKLLFQTSLDDRISYYKTLIRGAFAQKKSVYIVLPTEHDIEIFQEKLSKGIEDFTVTLFSGLNPKKQTEGFKKILSSIHPVLILGTAPYLSIPRADLETIILEHENSNAYKMIATPYFDLRIFVEIYATKVGARFILADTLLRFETIARRELDNFSEVHPLSFRINFNGNIETVSREKKENQRFQIFDDKTISEIKNKIENNKKVFIFSLRKGLATITVCHDCGESVMCQNCSAPVVLYLSKNDKKRMFICNHCQTVMNPEMTCLSCGSWNLMPFGIGTDTVFEELKKLFPKENLLQLDKEIAKTARGAERIIKEFEEKGGILVGTEMAVLYLKDKVPLSVIASFDSLWSIPNFRMGEKIIQLLTSIIAKTDEKIIIQTKNNKDRAVVAIETENILSFAREELRDRKDLGYPPYKRFIKITHLGDKEDTIKTKAALADVFREYDPLIFSGFVAKQRDKYMTNTLIRLEPQKWSLPELSYLGEINEDLSERLEHLPSDFHKNIDPEDLL